MRLVAVPLALCAIIVARPGFSGVAPNRGAAQRAGDRRDPRRQRPAAISGDHHSRRAAVIDRARRRDCASWWTRPAAGSRQIVSWTAGGGRVTLRGTIHATTDAFAVDADPRENAVPIVRHSVGPSYNRAQPRRVRAQRRLAAEPRLSVDRAGDAGGRRRFRGVRRRGAGRRGDAAVPPALLPEASRPRVLRAVDVLRRGIDRPRAGRRGSRTATRSRRPTCTRRSTRSRSDWRRSATSTSRSMTAFSAFRSACRRTGSTPTRNSPAGSRGCTTTSRRTA